MLTSLTPDEAAVFDVPNGLGALIVNETPEKGPGAGKLFAKDLIYTIEGGNVSDLNQARRMFNAHDPGDIVQLGVIRNGEFIDVEIDLVDGWKAQDAPTPDYYDGYLGLTLEMWGEKSPGGKFDSPVITQVKSLSPAHMGYIKSSQKTLLNSGPMIFPVQLDVKTITGVVTAGNYYPVSSIEELDGHVYEAYKSGAPILLEIEVWARKNLMKFNEPLERQEVSFHRVMPELTAARIPEMPDRAGAIVAHR